MSKIGKMEPNDYYKYTVIFFRPESPIGLGTWINKMYAEDKMKLVSFSGEYYVFENREGDFSE